MPLRRPLRPSKRRWQDCPQKAAYRDSSTPACKWPAIIVSIREVSGSEPFHRWSGDGLQPGQPLPPRHPERPPRASGLSIRFCTTGRPGQWALIGLRPLAYAQIPDYQIAVLRLKETRIVSRLLPAPFADPICSGLLPIQSQGTGFDRTIIRFGR
jgi:hypothetical protein